MIEKYMYSGSSCAGVVATGITGFFLGLATLIHVALSAMNPLLTSDSNQAFFALPACCAVFVWISGWYFLHISWKRKNVKRRTAHRVATILMLAGLLATISSIVNFRGH